MRHAQSLLVVDDPDVLIGGIVIAVEEVFVDKSCESRRHEVLDLVSILVEDENTGIGCGHQYLVVSHREALRDVEHGLVIISPLLGADVETVQFGRRGKPNVAPTIGLEIKILVIVNFR